MAKQDDKPNDPRSLRRQAREVADSLAIAFILAMIIRHYILEVFKIPTKSMEPTLLGDPSTGDKILVNKFAYDFRDPRRWEIAVFKYPEDTTKNYIKRIVGLPGETILVQYGDVYITPPDEEAECRIARKPWSVQQALWRLTPHLQNPEARPKPWRVTSPNGEQTWSADSEFTLDAASPPRGEAELRYTREIRVYDVSDGMVPPKPEARLLTSDIMAEFSLIPRQQAGSLSVEIPIVKHEATDDSRSSADLLDFWEARFPLDRAGASPEVWRSEALVAAGATCRLPTGKPSLIQVANVDLTFIVRVDGVELVRKEYDWPDRVAESSKFRNEARLRIRCNGAHVTVRDPKLYVDVYYTQHPQRRGVRYFVGRERDKDIYAGTPCRLGPDEFFALGDNSANSNDSRGWEKSGAVPRSYLVGEAFLVLWPLGRMKFVR
ncbi:MAG: signal peptidase I [Planctomycetes bacterium]|nr:signal peptidase I [Planctomycetota bacterium]